jgi:hypothetical protein
MAGTKGRTGFNRLTAGRTKGNGMGGKKRGHQRKMRTHNRTGR